MDYWNPWDIGPHTIWVEDCMLYKLREMVGYEMLKILHTCTCIALAVQKQALHVRVGPFLQTPS